MRRHPYVDFTSPSEQEAFESSKPAEWAGQYNASTDELADLIRKKATEPRLQLFFEQHPYLLPGVDDLGHGPFGGVVTTKFKLGNIYQTDFAFVTSTSQTLCFTCVEIESARKRLFRRDGTFSRDYFDARQQIGDWLFWAHHHVRDAIECWMPLITPRMVHFMTIRFQGYLLFGSRQELDAPKKRERWAGEDLIHVPGLKTMTYDRLLDRREFLVPHMDNSRLVVCNYRQRRFQAKRVCA
jgi:hypothetical protein